MSGPNSTYTALARLAAPDGTVCASVATLARVARVHQTTVRRELAALEAAGVLEIHRGQNVPNLYRIVDR